MKIRKKLAAVLSAAALTLSMTALQCSMTYAETVSSEAVTAESDYTTHAYKGMTIRCYSDHAEVVGASAMEEFNVPAEYNGVPVTVIGEEAFARRALIKKITLPDTVKTIGEGAFASTPVEQIVLPDSLERLPIDAFRNCQSLSIVNIPSSLKEIGDYCFYQCSSLPDVTLPEGLEKIGKYAFSQTMIEKTYLPSTVTELGENCFYRCDYLESVTLSESLRTIGKDCFKLCYNLSDITCNSNVIESVGSSILYSTDYYNNHENGLVILGNALVAFKNGLGYLSSIDYSVSIPEGVTAIADSIFSNIGIKNISLPEGMLCIGSSAFYCTQLTELKLPESIRKIGTAAFKSTKITSVYIPDSCESIGRAAFESSCLEEILLSENNENFTLSDGILYNADTTVLIQSTMTVTSCTLPSTLKVIPAEAFRQRTALASITIPEGVEFIGYYAFFGCTGLKEVVIPSSVMEIDSYAFSQCSGIAGLKIKYGTETIGYGAFAYCTGLTSLRLPDSVTTLSPNAFYGSSLEELVLSNNITELPVDYIDICVEPCPPDTVVVDDPYFPECYESWFNNSPIKKVTFSNSVKTIGYGVFYTSSVTDIYFYGSQEDWDAIEIGGDNPGLEDLTIHFSAGSEGRGDTDWDGNVSISDLVALQRYLANPQLNVNMVSADVNQDGTVNIFDFIILKREIISMYTTPPEC
ncbi:MAG: leucine-rich repeat protein [Porcipelethomonas sp.]